MKFRILLVIFTLIFLTHATSPSPPRTQPEMKRWSVEWPQPVSQSTIDIGLRVIRDRVPAPLPQNPPILLSVEGAI